MSFTVHHGDCLDILRTLPDNSIDAAATDPPGGGAFMNLAWDSNRGGWMQWVRWLRLRSREMLRTLKPGAHAVVWSYPKTEWWTPLALHLSGFEVRRPIHHLFATGFPKSHNVAMAIDKMLGADREKVRVPAKQVRNPKSVNGGHGVKGADRPYMQRAQETGYHDMTSPDPVSDAAKQWSGYGTDLKPATEVWWLCRKPLHGTVASNVMEFGTGALNIPACRIGDDIVGWGGGNGLVNTHSASRYGGLGSGEARPVEGRWPPAWIVSHAPRCTGKPCFRGCPVLELRLQGANPESWWPVFFCPKPDVNEREAGLDDIDPGVLHRVNGGHGLEDDPKWGPVERRNDHETLKSVDLMRWLCRLVTPPGGTVIDPFAGSFSTGVACMWEGFDFVGIEQQERFCRIGEARMRHAESLARFINEEHPQPTRDKQAQMTFDMGDAS